MRLYLVCTYMSPPVTTCHHMSPKLSPQFPPPATACHHMSPHVTTCHHVSPCVTTCHHNPRSPSKCPHNYWKSSSDKRNKLFLVL